MTDDEKSADDVTATTPQPDPVPDAEIIEAVTPRESERQVPPVTSRRRGGAGAFLGMVLGGVLAAAAGFWAARIIPGGWPLADTSALVSQLTAQAQEIAALKADLAAVQARPQPDTTADIAQLRADIGSERRIKGFPRPTPHR
jgi:hypothetical protein